MSQLYNLFELFIKSPADNKRNGVVGNKGKKIPNIPNPKDIRPIITRRYFTTLFVGCFSTLFT